MRKLQLIVLLLSLMALASCGGDRFDVDLSDINQQPVKIKRLEIDLFSIDTNQMFEESAGLQNKYGSFFE